MQRPNILRLAEIDLAILRAGAGWLQKARKLRSDLQGIVGEFGEKLYEEIVRFVMAMRSASCVCAASALSVTCKDKDQ